MAIGEFDLIKKYFSNLGPQQGVALGIGDDCALLDIPDDQQLATSVDTLVADVHFPAGGDAELIAQKALRCNLSDLAACGAEPLAFTLSLTLPQADETWLAQFANGLRKCADEFAIALIGGDTTRGPVAMLSIQVFGRVPRGQALLRSGARAGDQIYLSGTVGDARAALDVLNLPVMQLNNDQRFWLKRYYMPRPRINLGLALRGVASAAIDISDGLAADLGHILERSDVGAVLDATSLPYSSALHAHPRAQEFALHGGDDYELCFTVPMDKANRVAFVAQNLQLRLTRIGEITAQKTLRLQMADGSEIALAAGGYQHF